MKCLVLFLALLVASAPGFATEIPEPIPLPVAEPSLLQQTGDLLIGRPVAAIRLVFGVALLPLSLPVAALLGDYRWSLEVCIEDPLDALIARPLSWP